MESLGNGFKTRKRFKNEERFLTGSGGLAFCCRALRRKVGLRVNFSLQRLSARCVVNRRLRKGFSHPACVGDDETEFSSGKFYFLRATEMTKPNLQTANFIFCGCGGGKSVCIGERPDIFIEKGSRPRRQTAPRAARYFLPQGGFVKRKQLF